MKGGVYDWANMPYAPTSSITDTEAEAIGKLTYDIGCSVGMAWASGGSGASMYSARLRLLDTFGYASCEGVVFNSTNFEYSLEHCKSVVIPSLEYGSPLIMSISGAGGHAVVVDGYGYSGDDDDFYMHVNCGWGGSYNAWYCPPDLTMGYYAFNAIDGFLFSILPEEKGTIVSGRVLDASGAPVVGAEVKLVPTGGIAIAETISNSSGIYAFLATTIGTYTLKAEYGGSSAVISTKVVANSSKQLASNGGYYSQTAYAPTIGNSYDNDITITGLKTVETPTISPATCSFESTLAITLACATDGATIRYTLDGTDPTETSEEYTGPVTITESLTFKARAFKDGMNSSLVASETYSCNSLSSALDTPTLSWTTSSDFPFVAESDDTYDGVDAARSTDSGDYWDNQSWMQTEIAGPATMSFYYKTTKAKGTFYVEVGGERVYEETNQVYNSSWQLVSVSVPEGVQMVKIGFYGWIVDGNNMNAGRYTGVFNGATVDSVTVEYPSTATSTTEVPVPYEWLDEYFPGSGTNADAYETLAKAAGVNGYSVWESYLAGLVPTNAESKLQAFIRFDGTSPVIEWNITNLNARTLGYGYSVKGKSSLADAEWGSTNQYSRFFKVFLTK